MFNFVPGVLPVAQTSLAVIDPDSYLPLGTFPCPRGLYHPPLRAKTSPKVLHSPLQWQNWSARQAHISLREYTHFNGALTETPHKGMSKHLTLCETSVTLHMFI